MTEYSRASQRALENWFGDFYASPIDDAVIPDARHPHSSLVSEDPGCDIWWSKDSLIVLKIDNVSVCETLKDKVYWITMCVYRDTIMSSMNDDDGI